MAVRHIEPDCIALDEIAVWFPEAQLKRSGVEMSSAQLLTALRQVLREAGPVGS